MVPEPEKKTEDVQNQKGKPRLFSRQYKIYLAIMIPLVLIAVAVLAYLYLSFYATLDSVSG